MLAPSFPSPNLSALLRLPTPLLLLAHDFTISHANRSARKLLGIDGLERYEGVPLDRIDIHILDINERVSCLHYLQSAQKAYQLKCARRCNHDRVNPICHADAGDSEDEVDMDSFWDCVESDEDTARTLHARVQISRHASVPARLGWPAACQPNGPVDADMNVVFPEMGTADHIVIRFARPLRAPVFLPEHRNSLDQAHLGHWLSETSRLPKGLQRAAAFSFDNWEKAAYVIDATGDHFLANSPAKKYMGSETCQRAGTSLPLLWEYMVAWDENFTAKLTQDELPAVRLIRNHKNFSKMIAGVFNVITGEKSVVHIRGECIWDPGNGEFLGSLITLDLAEEVTDYRKATQNDWARSHETICNLMPHFVWTTDTNGFADYFSDRWYVYTGLSKEDSMGLGFQKALHPDDVGVLMGRFAQAIETRTECEGEFRYRRHDGVYRWMLARAAPWKDENGKLQRWYGTNTDIDKLVRERMMEEKTKTQIMTILDHADLHLFGVDADGMLRLSQGSMNWRNTVDLKYLDRDRLAGRNFFDVVGSMGGGRGNPRLLSSARAILNGEKQMDTGSDCIVGRYYKTHMMVDPTIGDDSDGKESSGKRHGLLGITLDTTDVHSTAELQMENSRLQLEESASRQASKLKSRFLANMSHEIRTPLSGILGMQDMLVSFLPSCNKEQQECLDGIRLSAETLLNIVNDILDFSKVESGRLDLEKIPFNISESVFELSQVLGFTASQKQLHYVFDNRLPKNLVVLGDPGRIRQVLSNLLTNSFKFTKQGRVRLSARMLKASQDTVEVEFKVEDTGVGIHEDHVKKLFKPFFQGDSSTARVFGGTGLGLTISKNLAELMNGTLSMQSTFGKGSKATFTIPLKTTSAECVPSTLLQSPKHAQDGKRGSSMPAERVTAEQKASTEVLLVEDNATNAKIAKFLIRNLGYPIEAVKNGRECVNYLASLSPQSAFSRKAPPRRRPSIVLMDIQMPFLDGYQTTSLIRQKYGADTDASNAGSLEASADTEMPELVRIRDAFASDPNLAWVRDVPIIAMTASAIQGDRDKCLGVGMNSYLSKPVRKQDLENMLATWCLKTLAI